MQRPSFYKDPKPIFVNNIEFPSIAAAARVLKANHSQLIYALNNSKPFRGMSVCYVNEKDVPVNPTNYKPKTTIKKEYKMTKRHEQKVIIEGQEFNSITAAAKYVGCDASCIRWALNFNKNRKYKELSVKFADPVKEAEIVANLDETRKLKNKQRKINRHNKYKGNLKHCPIYCENLNKRFETLTAAAKFAKTSAYTLSTKTEVAGRYVDKEGNVYTRLKPMQHRTKFDYPNTGDTLRKIMSARTVKENVVEPISIPMPVESKSAVQVAKDLLKDRILAYIKTDDFKMAKELMDVVETLKE